MEMGKPRMQAAIEGAREVGFTIISMTVSLVAVFIPVLFLEWHYRPAAARVFHHYCGCGADIGRDFVDSDAHVVQPLPADDQRRMARSGFYNGRSGSSIG